MAIEHEIPEDWAPVTLRQEMTCAARALARVIVRLRAEGRHEEAETITYHHNAFVRDCGEILE